MNIYRTTLKLIGRVILICIIASIVFFLLYVGIPALMTSFSQFFTGFITTFTPQHFQ